MAIALHAAAMPTISFVSCIFDDVND